MIRQINKATTIGVLLLTLIAILAGILFWNTAYYGLLVGLLLVLAVGYRAGYPLKELYRMMENGVRKASIVLIVMSLIGMLSALWMKSGTIPAMMDLGFQYLSNMNYPLAVFLITSAISMVLGTAIGTMSTVGIPLLEIGRAIGVPLPLIVGAIVSGAYIGDRSSPMSSSANLTATISGTKLIPMLKESSKTLMPVFMISVVFYYILGKPYVAGENVMIHIGQIKELLNTFFIINWYSLIPPLMILLLALLKLPIVYCMLTGLITSLLMIIGIQGFQPQSLLKVMLLGFHPENSQIASLISGGGLLSMKNVILIIAISTAINGLMDSMGMLKPLMEGYIKGIKNTGQLYFKTASLSILTAILTCNQSLAIIVPGGFLKEEFNNRGISPNKLGRTITDSGVVSVSLIPWNVNAAAITLLFGVATTAYLPYALLCYLFPVVTVLYGYLEGKGKEEKKEVEEY